MTPVLALVEKFDPGWLSYSPVSTAAVKVSTWPGEAQNVAAESPGCRCRLSAR